MGRSISVPSRPDASFRHGPALLSVTSNIHSVRRDGLTAEYPVAFAIGSGNVGHSYAVRIGDELVQSPLSWFSQAGRWDVSPGFEKSPALDFDRRITMECLYCHTGGMRKVNDPPHAITCDRCHVPEGKHFGIPRDNACEQCHLQGEARVLSPGSTWSDAAPRYTTYVGTVASGALKVVSQVEQLALSKCGKLSCATCHSPHGAAKDQRAVCLTCHAATLTASHVTRSDCASCHMPRRSTPEIAHTAYTDHRIRRNAQESSASGPKVLKAWREPQAPERERNLALAQIYVGERDQSVSMVQQGFSALLSLKEKDAPVYSALGTVLMQKQRPVEAAVLFAKAAELDPRNAEHAQNTGVALFTAGKPEAAAKQLERAIALDPLLEQAYSLLAEISPSDRRTKILEQWLKAMPQSFKARETSWKLSRTCDAGESCYYYGRNLYSLNRFEESLEVLKRAPGGDPRVHVAIALDLEALGRLQEAESEFKTAMRAGTTSPDDDPRIAYGVFLSHSGRTKEALVPLREAAKAFPKYARSRYELGRVLYQLDRLEEAESELRAALLSNPEDTTAHRLLTKTQARLDAQRSVTVK